MKKLYTLFLVTLLSSCSATTDTSTKEADLKVLDLTADSTQTEQYWNISKRIDPLYPQGAVRKSISGCVEFSFVIAKSGRAHDIKIIKAVPAKIFNKAAMKSLKQYRWTPADNNLLLNPVLTTIQLDFSMSRDQVVKGCTVS